MTNGSDTYRTLFDLYVSGYRATSTSLRSKEENETIDSTLSTFGGLTDKTDQEIAELAASLDPGEAFAAEDMTTILEAGLSNIKDIFAKAVEWDAAHVKAASVTSQANVAKVADAQEATDQELVANLTSLVFKANEALVRAAAAGEPAPEPTADPEKTGDTVVEPAPEPQADPEEADEDMVETADEEAQQTGKMNEQLMIDDEDLSGAAEPDDELPGDPDADDLSEDDED